MPDTQTYHADGLARLVRGVAELAPPSRPRLVNDLLWLDVDSTTHVIGGQTRSMAGPSLDWIRDLIVPLLDGTRTRTGLLADLPGLDESVLADVIQILHVNGLLEDAAGDPGPDSQDPAADDQLLAFLGRYLRVTGRHANRHQVQRCAAQTRILAIGPDPDTEEVVAILGGMAVTDIRRQRGMVDAPADVDLVVVLGPAPVQHAAAAHAVRSGVAMLSADLDHGRLGPLCLPGSSACVTCAELQQPTPVMTAGTVTDGVPERLWRRALVAQAAQQAFAFASGLFRPRLWNAVEHLEPATRRATAQPVWWLPACPTCGKDTRRGTVRLASGHQDSAALIYHRNTTPAPWHLAEPAAYETHFSSGVRQLVEGAYLEHDWATRAELPAPTGSLSAEGLWEPAETLAGPLTGGAVATVLRYAAGVAEPPSPTQIHGGQSSGRQRFTASSGNLGSAEVYLIADGVPELAKGVYHYLSTSDSLELIPTEPPGRALRRWLGHRPDAVFVVVGAVDRQAAKYGARGYLLCLLDAGLMTHRIELLARAHGLRTRTQLDFSDQEIAELLHLDPQRLAPIAMVAVSAEVSDG